MWGGFFLRGGISFALLTTDHKNTKGSKDEMEKKGGGGGDGGGGLLPLREWQTTRE